MEDSLNAQAKRLKKEVSLHLHALIDTNHEWVSEEMDAKPGGIDLREGMAALHKGLPSPDAAKKVTTKKITRGNPRRRTR